MIRNLVSRNEHAVSRKLSSSNSNQASLNDVWFVVSCNAQCDYLGSSTSAKRRIKQSSVAFENQAKKCLASGYDHEQNIFYQ